MHSPWTSSVAMLALAVATSGVLVATAQQKPEPLTLGPARERGASVTPAYEGWYQNEDGSFSLLIGYYNRNSKQPLDIPIGPNNRIEPGDPDQGQPTHFETGRQWGVFVLKVPKDFGKRTITWTIVANGEVQTIPLTLNPGYPITPYKELGMGNQPPVLSFSAGGAKVTGPPMMVAATLSGKVGQPVPVQVWAEDPKPEGGTDESAAPARGKMSGIATVSFHKYRGPGAVTFDQARVPVSKQGEMVAATATFEAAGEYLLRVQANDESGEGGGGFQCCWTNTYVKVTVQ
jgi:hypothetical protein